ncbi:MAG TPA: ABC transporter substrate-binding protein [Candidatus Binatia bacterium]|jgi:ABC-type Fe3+ transport system substrate-binding protein
MRNIRFALACQLFLLFILSVQVGSAETPDAIYSKLETLPPEKRRQVLIDGAKKERELMLYSTLTQASVIDAALEKAYPFLNVQVWREGRGSGVADRALAEARSGRLLGDVTIGANSGLFPMLKGGILARYRSGEAAHFEKDYIDPDRYWSTAFFFEWVFVYNPTLADKSKAPETYMNLLDPYWKGKIVADPLPNSFIKGALRVYGEKKAAELFKRLVEEQHLNFRRGRTLQAQLIAAGEFPAAIEISVTHPKQMKAKGAPIDYHYIYPTPVTLAPVSIFKAAPHPHAAALAVDFILSKEGQKLIASLGYSVARRDVDVPEEAAKKARVIIPLDWEWKMTDEVRRVAKEYFALKSRGG